MFYVLLHVIYWTQCLIDTKDLHSRHVPIVTLVCIYSVGYKNNNNYYYYYYYPILTNSCDVFTDIKESKNAKFYENYCSVHSAVIGGLKVRHTNRQT